MCRTRGEAEAPPGSLRQILGELGLELEGAKTGIVHLEEEAMVSISSASIAAGCAPTAPGTPAGPHAGRCSTPATVSVRSRRANGWLLPIEDTVEDLDGTCAAGRG